jgi:protein-S-isoprenylcysteine O-methyltransferase Ste14
MGAFWMPYVVRATAKVDRFLITELPSYEAYARHVRYRLFPGVW